MLPRGDNVKEGLASLLRSSASIARPAEMPAPAALSRLRNCLAANQVSGIPDAISEYKFCGSAGGVGAA